MDRVDFSQQDRSCGGAATLAPSRLPCTRPSEASSDDLLSWPEHTRNPEIDQLIDEIMMKLRQSLSLGVIIVDGRSRLLFADALARQLLLRGDVIIQRREHLRPIRSASGRVWLELIHRMSESAMSDARLIQLTSMTGKPLLTLLQPITEPTGAPTGKVLLLASDRDFHADLVPDDLGSLYELTRSEVRLLGALLRGQSVKDFALAAGLSNHTVRSQLKAIFRKTGYGRQAELVSAILRDPLLHLVTCGAAARRRAL
jgi:DNA-binding CsgD family transcriptional regulator